MTKVPSTKKPHRITVQFKSGTRDGQTAKLPWSEAQELIDSGKAIAISQNLFRAARLGVDIRKIKGNDRRNDSLIKELMKKQRSEDESRQKKKDAARAKVRSAE